MRSRIMWGASGVAIALVLCAVALGRAQQVVASSGMVLRGNYEVPGFGELPIYLSAQTWVPTDGSTNMRHVGVISTKESFAEPPDESNTLPQGWLRVNIVGYVNGIPCGETGWINSTEDTSTMHEPVTICWDLPGQQEYVTEVYGGIWNGTDYTEVGPQSSPVLLR